MASTKEGRQMKQNQSETPYEGYPRPAGPAPKPVCGMNSDPDIPRFGADEVA